MSRQFTRDFLIEVAKGNISGHSLVQKFGRNPAVGTSFVPVSISGLYNTPQPAAATTLRVKAGNANDTAAGSGARSVTLQGLDETGTLVEETLATAGASASTATSATYMRLFRVWVATSGTYATQSSGSHAADIVIENGAGGTDWLTISFTGFPRSQSEVAAYSVPLGKTVYLLDINITSDSSRVFDYIFFKRENILDAAAPYQAMRIQTEGIGLAGDFKREFRDPVKFDALTDIGIMAEVGASTGDISAEFNLLVVDD